MSGHYDAWGDLNFVISMLVTCVFILISAILIVVFLKSIIFASALIFTVVLFLPKIIYELRRHILDYFKKLRKDRLAHNTVIIGGVRGDKHIKRIPITRKVPVLQSVVPSSSKGVIMQELGLSYEKPPKNVNDRSPKTTDYHKVNNPHAIWSKNRRVHPKALELIKMTEEQGRVVIKGEGNVSGHHGHTLGALIESAIKRIETNVELNRQGDDLILTLNKGEK